MNLTEWIKYIAPASPRSDNDVLGIFSSWSLRPSALWLGRLNVRSRPSAHTSPADLTCFPHLLPSSSPRPRGSPPPWSFGKASFPKPSSTSKSLHHPQGPDQLSALLLHQAPLELISPSSQAPRLISCPLLMVMIPLYLILLLFMSLKPSPKDKLLQDILVHSCVSSYPPTFQMESALC